MKIDFEPIRAINAQNDEGGKKHLEELDVDGTRTKFVQPGQDLTLLLYHGVYVTPVLFDSRFF